MTTVTMFMVMGSGIFLILALLLRELQFSRERAALMANQEQLRLSLEGTRVQLRRSAEDVFVLQTLLVERHVIDEGELARGRARLIELPRRRAQEKDAMSRNLGLGAGQLMVEDNDSSKIH